MAATTDTKIDIPLMLWRLAPAAEYHWKGNGGGTYADIGEWRSPLVPKPTEAAVYAEWDVYLAEKKQIANRDNALRNRIDTQVRSAVGAQLDQLDPAQIRALLIVLLKREGAIAADGSIKAPDTWGS